MLRNNTNTFRGVCNNTVICFVVCAIILILIRLLTINYRYSIIASSNITSIIIIIIVISVW